MPRKILYMAADRPVVQSVETNLAQAGYQVVVACDGSDGLRRVEAEKPDLIVLDLTLPDISGFEVIRCLQANPDTAVIPVITLSTKSQERELRRTWQTGIDCYLTKPVNTTELLKFIKRIFYSETAEPICWRESGL